jgi:magnesium transporter
MHPIWLFCVRACYGMRPIRCYCLLTHPSIYPSLRQTAGRPRREYRGTVLSALSAGAVTQKDAYRIIGKEALSGLVIGCLLGLAVGAVAHVGMGISVHVATVVACTLPVMSTIAATLGSAIPFGCVFLGLDPSVIAAPAMTSFVDVTGLLAYFLLANYIFSLFGIAL